MAITIKDSVYKAIDVIVGKRIEDLHLDKTIEATVVKCLSINNGKYRLKYGSGVFDAYSYSDEIYMPNTSVYVLIPENDFNKKKTIIGKANTGSQTSTREEQNVASMFNGYSVIGKNILSPTENNSNKFGLASHSHTNVIELYNAENINEDNLLSVDNEKLKIYLEETKGFLFSGKFKTNFVKQQIASTQGNYGLRFNIILKNGKTSFENMQARWDAQEPKTICKIEDNTIRLNNYRENIENILYNIRDGVTVKVIQKNLNNQLIKLQTFIAQLNFVDSATLELVKLYSQLINELTQYTIDIYGEPITIQILQEQYEDWFTNASYAFQEDIYTIELDTYKMSGNTYYYTSPSYQYLFTEIDADAFVRIDSIYFYCKDFPYNPELHDWGYDIQVEDVSIACIKYLDNTNGDYHLDVEYEDIYFHATAKDQDTLDITAKLIYKNTTDVTNYSQIMWFRRNENITPSSTFYSMYAGAGWEHITSINNEAISSKASTLTLSAKDNLAYRNLYKVVAMYESSAIVQQEFTIYNERYKHNISLISDSGLSFGVGAGKKTITCVIDNNTVVSSDNYRFVWYKELEDGSYYQIKDDNGLIELQNTINNPDTDLEVKSAARLEFNALTDIKWIDNTNSIIVNSAAVPNNSKVKIICKVFSLLENTEVLLDTASIELDSGYSINLKNYYIEIINGNQVFQYNESGIAPSSDIYEDPLVPQPLTCNFYDPNGGIINPLRYNVSWEIPITNTLIHTDTSSLMYNSITDSNNLLQSDSCIFTINNEYDYNATNNQIICIVEFNDGEGLVKYRQSTSFFFGKVGDDGTNGTDVVSKITVIYNDHPNVKSNYNNNTLLDELLTLKITQETISTDNEESIIKNSYIWNNGLTMDDPILQLELFKNNNIVNSKEYHKVSWSILNNGLVSKYWSTQNVSNETTGAKQAIIVYDDTKNNKKTAYTNYIIKAQADLPIDENKYQTYYNFYPICTDQQYQTEPYEYTYDKYNEDGEIISTETKTSYNNYYVGIDRARTLRQVVYNSDGRNPLYDKNLGIGLSFKNLDYPRTIIWEPHGGIILNDKIEELPSFSLGKTKSYIAAYDKEIDDILENLEFTKAQAIIEEQERQEQNVIDIIKENINNELIVLNQERRDNNNTRVDLVQQRTTSWQTFKQQRLAALQDMYNRLCNLIDSNILIDNWIIEDYIYYENVKYYNNTGVFYNTIKSYLETKINNDDPDMPTNIDLTVQSELLDKLIIDVQDIEDEDIKNSIELNFLTLKNLFLTGYETYKIIYDRRNKELNDNIANIEKTLINITAQQNNYNNALSMISEDSVSFIPNIIEYIKAILFEDSFEYAKLNNELLLSIVLSIKQQFEDNIKVITNKYDIQIAFLTGIITDDSDPTFCSIVPNEVYSGEYPNQYVKIKIYQGLVDKIDNTSVLEHELIIPFHMSLNTYGLASLNAWDGSSVEINEDEGYVLAPQIGAGVKHVEDNTFTGVLMGTEKTYDDREGQEEIGLLGYSHGKRSIFLDASTGNATFGLPETDAADVSNPLTEGRIELRPGGTSSISKWNFDSRSIYRVSTDDEEEAILQTKTYIKQASANSLGAPYEDAPQYAHGSIPHKKQGILLSALPAYASFKGRILTETDHTEERVNYLNLNTSVREGDTFELQIDPNDSRFFSLYEHSTRIYEGYGTCDTLNGYQEPNKYPLTEEEFNEYFSIFIRGNASEYYDIDPDNTIILTQRYLRLNTNNQMRQIFRPLSYLYQDNQGKHYWKIVRPTVDKRNRDTNEYVIATLKQYVDWQNDNRKQTIWKYITFSSEEGIIPEDIPLQSIYDNYDNLIGLSLLNNNIINDNTEVWHRYKKAGIDATGKFVAEGIGTGSLGMGLNDIQAFNIGSLFIGANFESNNGTIVQFFVDKLSTDVTSPLFISSSKLLSNPSIEDTSHDDEGRRPVRIYAGQDYGDLNTGIFVGQTVKQNPTNKISKIELSQTSKNDNKIILSALGEYTEENSSTLSLVSSSETEQEGSLNHTGDWITNIGGKLNYNVGNNLSFIGAGSANTIVFNGNLSTTINTSSKINITNNNITLTNNANNILNLRNKSGTTNINSVFTGYHGIDIIGGYGNTSGNAAKNSLVLWARNSSDGMRLIASRSTGTGTGAQSGDTILQLLPGGTTSTNARFYLRAGDHSYVDSMSNGVILGTNLKVGHDGKGKIQGDGINISNTAGGKTVGPTSAVTISGWGSSGTIKVPRVVMSNGRPTFSEYNFKVNIPAKPTDYSQDIKNLQNKVSTLTSNLQLLTNTVKLLNTSYKNHTHKLSTGAAAYLAGTPGANQSTKLFALMSTSKP